MKNLKWYLAVVMVGFVVCFFYTYICNINLYKKLCKISIDNKIIKSFTFDEKEYDVIVKRNIEGIGNYSLRNNVLSKSRYQSLKKDVKNYVSNDLFKQMKAKAKANDKNNNVYRKYIYKLYNDLWCGKIIERILVKQYKIDDKVKNIVSNIYNEAKYFPIAKLERNKGEYPFENSWMGARNYGGNRKHEGIDIMYTENKEEVVPIVSVSDGVIEKKGWLELGGYRILIRANNKVKFYYAHLSSYAHGLKEGMQVKAGQVLGYMGSTGYGKEGTKDKFDVHLHLGMYYEDKGREISINPYFLLKMLKFNNLCYK